VIAGWVGRDVVFPGLDEGLDVQNFYRAMDHLLPHKDRIERCLFDRLTTLFNLDVSLVFYDTTLAYFEGDGMEDLVRFSRKNKRLEKKEVLICVVMSRDGFPIYHEVLPGNRNDVSTGRPRPPLHRWEVQVHGRSRDLRGPLGQRLQPDLPQVHLRRLRGETSLSRIGQGNRGRS
jgi:hypothetical protein